MKIKLLELKKFRNYNDLKIKLNDNLNVIIGNNAQGKTNILESIYYLSITKSFLGVNDKNIIKKDELFFKIKSEIVYKDNNKELSILFNENDKRLEIDNVIIKKHSDFIGNLKVILYSPNDIRLIRDGPSIRRRYLNIEISQLDNRYVNLLNEYNIVLKQRNEYLRYLKDNKSNDIYLSIVNEKFVNLAIDIYKYRISFIDNINKYIGSIFKDISSYDNLSIKYVANVDVSNIDNIHDILLNKLESNLDREIGYGTCLYGPHRDDFTFNILDNDLILYGSQGQQKMAVLSLKLSEIDAFYEYSKEYPVVLLDDLFSELDIDKRNNVLKYLNKDIQTIITTTDLENINKDLLCNSYIYNVNNGKVIMINENN